MLNFLKRFLPKPRPTSQDTQIVLDALDGPIEWNHFKYDSCGISDIRFMASGIEFRISWYSQGRERYFEVGGVGLDLNREGRMIWKQARRRISEERLTRWKEAIR